MSAPTREQPTDRTVLVWEALDRGDTTGARRITNGGLIGLDHVNALRAQVMKVLAA